MPKKETSNKTKKNEKVVKTQNNKQIIIAIILIIVLILCILFSVNTIKRHNDNNDQNNPVKNVNILDDATVESLKITNVSIEVNDGVSTYRGIVTNTDNTSYHIDKLYIILAKDDIIEKIPALADITIKAGESSYIDLIIDHDITQIDKISYAVE